MGKRTPYDGEPYYCKVCGLGYAEWGACEEDDCRLETESEAKSRQKENTEIVSSSGSVFKDLNITALKAKGQLPFPAREGWFWAKLINPTGMPVPDLQDWVSSDWEVVEIIDNNGKGDEAFAVAFPGIGPWQWPNDCIFGPEVIKPKELRYEHIMSSLEFLNKFVLGTHTQYYFDIRIGDKHLRGEGFRTKKQARDCLLRQLDSVLIYFCRSDKIVYSDLSKRRVGGLQSSF